MSHLLILTSAPAAMALQAPVIAQLEPILQFHCRDESWQPRWLAEGQAWEAAFEFDGLADPDDNQSSQAQLAADVKSAMRDLAVDVNIIADAGPQRRKKLLIADMDSTIIEQECIDEIADLAGVGARVSDITERAMRGELNFEAALRERVGLLKGLDEGKLQQIYDERLSLMPGARKLVQTMRAHGAFCALVSGGFTFFTSRIAETAGFHVNQANRLMVADGKLTGTAGDPILGRQAKLDALQRLTKERQLRSIETLAVGDGANDLDMIKAAGLGVAYRAKPIVARAAQCAISHGDLTALLYLQGYRKDEFVGG